MSNMERILKLDEKLSSLSNLIEGPLPDNVFSKKEISISIIIVYKLFRIFNTTKYDKNDFLGTLEDIFAHNKDLLNHVQELVRYIHYDKLDKFSRIEFEDFSGDFLGNWLQFSLSKKIRKEYATNYTQNAIDLLNYIINPRSINESNYIISDPFCGSGRLILAYLNYCKLHKLNYPDKILINDIMPTAVLISYYRIINDFPLLKTKIHASIGNGFKFSTSADLFLINPPFTRSHLIPDETKRQLKPLYSRYKKYNTGQAGLHFWAVLYLLDFLKPNGILFAILPLSIISSTYSKALQGELLNPNIATTFSTSKYSKAFSEGSDLKEISMLVQNSINNNFVKFQRHNKTFQITSAIKVHKSKLNFYWNWSLFFRNSKLIALATKLVEKLNLVTAGNLEISIKRGIEMYGPDFFFLPNRYFTLQFSDNVAIISDGDNYFNFPVKYVEKILRKPGNYKEKISPTPRDYCLKLPPSKNSTISHFIRIHKSKAKVAQNRFGSSWFNHTTKQLLQKKPYGFIFLIDKLDLTSSPTLAYYTDEKLSCTKNFYVLQAKDPINPIILAAWFNSSLYLLLYLAFRREIGGTYGRLQIIDYFNLPIFLPIIFLKHTRNHNSIITAFNKLRNQNIPPLIDQLRLKEKRSLDQAWIDFLKLEISIDYLHHICTSVMEVLTQR